MHIVHHHFKYVQCNLFLASVLFFVKQNNTKEYDLSGPTMFGFVETFPLWFFASAISIQCKVEMIKTFFLFFHLHKLISSFLFQNISPLQSFFATTSLRFSFRLFLKVTQRMNSLWLRF